MPSPSWIYLVSNPLEEVTPKQALDITRIYVKAVFDEDSRTLDLSEGRVSNIFGSYLSFRLAPEHFEALVSLIPLRSQAPSVPLDSRDRWERQVLSRSRRPVKNALTNSLCPVSVLTRACHSWHPTYAQWASQHRSCPPEDAVYAALQPAR